MTQSAAHMSREPLGPQEVASPEVVRTFPVEGGDAYLQVAQGRIDHQMSTLDALETKAAGLLAGGLATAAFLTALLAIRMSDGRMPSVLAWLLFAVAGILLTLVALSTVLGTRMRAWKTYPTPADAWTAAHTSHPVAWELARVLEAAYDGNLDDQARKTRHINIAIWTFLAQIAITAVTAVALLV